MDDDVKTLLSSPFVASWIGRARDGDRFAAETARRASAWAQWAVGSLRHFTGHAERQYPALLLDGRFHDPKGQGPLIKPHVEIPGRIMDEPDADFPSRLALFGNALAFPWWMVPEVLAIKRALFAGARSHLGELVQLLEMKRPALLTAVHDLQASVIPRWTEVEDLLVREPDVLCDAAAGDFTTEAINTFFPAGEELRLRVVYDSTLRERSGQRVARRVGVWMLEGESRDGTFAVGVTTPRLTASSQFNDSLFSPHRESAAALLVRGLLLERIGRSVLGEGSVSVGSQSVLVKEQGAYVRAVVAQVGQKLPEASRDAAVAFVYTYPDADMAWMVLEDWATKSSTVLTVREEGFKLAHRRVLRMVRRADDPDRDDINVLLPLGWDAQSRVVRVTFGRRQPRSEK